VLLEVLGRRQDVLDVIRRGARQAVHLRDVRAVDRYLRTAG